MDENPVQISPVSLAPPLPLPTPPFKQLENVAAAQGGNYPSSSSDSSSSSDLSNFDSLFTSRSTNGDDFDDQEPSGVSYEPAGNSVRLPPPIEQSDSSTMAQSTQKRQVQPSAPFKSPIQLHPYGRYVDESHIQVSRNPSAGGDATLLIINNSKQFTGAHSQNKTNELPQPMLSPISTQMSPRTVTYLRAPNISPTMPAHKQQQQQTRTHLTEEEMKQILTPNVNNLLLKKNKV